VADWGANDILRGIAQGIQRDAKFSPEIIRIAIKMHRHARCNLTT